MVRSTIVVIAVSERNEDLGRRPQNRRQLVGVAVCIDEHRTWVVTADNLLLISANQSWEKMTTKYNGFLELECVCDGIDQARNVTVNPSQKETFCSRLQKVKLMLGMSQLLRS